MEQAKCHLRFELAGRHAATPMRSITLRRARLETNHNGSMKLPSGMLVFRSYRVECWSFPHSGQGPAAEAEASKASRFSSSKPSHSMSHKTAADIFLLFFRCAKN